MAVFFKVHLLKSNFKYLFYFLPYSTFILYSLVENEAFTLHIILTFWWEICYLRIGKINILIFSHLAWNMKNNHEFIHQEVFYSHKLAHIVRVILEISYPQQPSVVWWCKYDQKEDLLADLIMAQRQQECVHIHWIADTRGWANLLSNFHLKDQVCLEDYRLKLQRSLP